MIQFTLACDGGHRFDAWFKNAQAFDEQAQKGVLSCPVCESRQVEKALMAPAVARGSETTPLAAGHPQFENYVKALRKLRRKMTAEADYVGEKFAEEARKIHYAEVEARGIYGEASREEVEGLVEEGIAFMPLPSVPEEHN